MARKLTDAEFVERTRENNRRRSERQRQRLMDGGKSALTVWIPDTLRAALNQAAAERGATIADTATQWLMKSAALTTTNRNTNNDATVDLLGDAKPVDRNTAPRSEPAPKLTQAERDERDRLILELHRQGLKNPDLGRRFNVSEGSIRRVLKRVQVPEATT